MSFLSPWFLFGLLGIAIPIAIHLIRREQAEPVRFSTIRFLKKVPRKRIFFQKLKQQLLLIVRIAIVALIALAFARPFLSSMLSEVVGIAPRSIVILIDTSMSMQHGDSSTQAQAAALEELRSLQPGDEASVIYFSDRADQVHELSTDLAELETVLQQESPSTYRSTRFLPTLRLANEILQNATYQDRSIYLISDFQQHAVTRGDAAWQLSPGVALETIQVGVENIRNLSVADAQLFFSEPTSVDGESADSTLSLPQSVPEISRSRSLRVRVSNRGTVHVSEARLTMEVDGKVMAQTELDLTEQSERVVEFPLPLEEEEAHQILVRVEEDEFLPDNSFFLTIEPERPTQILGLTERAGAKQSQDPSRWLRAAMQLAANTDFQLEVVGQLPPRSQLQNYDIFVLWDEPPNAVDGQYFNTIVQQGKSLVLVPTDTTRSSQFNERFRPITPAFLTQKQIYPRQSALIVTEVESHHPVFQALRQNQVVPFGNARYWGHWEVRLQETSESLMVFNNSEPLLLERTIGLGKVLLWTSPLDTQWNSFPLQIEFAPLIHEVFLHLSRQTASKAFYAIGERVPLRLPSETLVQISPPQSSPTEHLFPAGEVAAFSETYSPGFYRMQSKIGVEHFAVNIPAEESNFISMNPEELSQHLVSSEVETSTNAPARLEIQQAQLERSQQFWWGILLFVLLLGFVEVWLANRTYR